MWCGETVYKVQEKKSFSDTCEALHIIKKEHDKVYYYGRIIKLVAEVWVTWDVKKC